MPSLRSSHRHPLWMGRSPRPRASFLRRSRRLVGNGDVAAAAIVQAEIADETKDPAQSVALCAYNPAVKIKDQLTPQIAVAAAPGVRSGGRETSVRARSQALSPACSVALIQSGAAAVVEQRWRLRNCAPISSMARSGEAGFRVCSAKPCPDRRVQPPTKGIGRGLATNRNPSAKPRDQPR